VRQGWGPNGSDSRRSGITQALQTGRKGRKNRALDNRIPGENGPHEHARQREGEMESLNNSRGISGVNSHYSRQVFAWERTLHLTHRRSTGNSSMESTGKREPERAARRPRKRGMQKSLKQERQRIKHQDTQGSPNERPRQGGRASLKVSGTLQRASSKSPARHPHPTHRHKQQGDHTAKSQTRLGRNFINRRPYSATDQERGSQPRLTRPGGTRHSKDQSQDPSRIDFSAIDRTGSKATIPKHGCYVRTSLIKPCQGGKAGRGLSPQNPRRRLATETRGHKKCPGNALISSETDKKRVNKTFYQGKMARSKDSLIDQHQADL